MFFFSFLHFVCFYCASNRSRMTSLCSRLGNIRCFCFHRSGANRIFFILSLYLDRHTPWIRWIVKNVMRFVYVMRKQNYENLFDKRLLQEIKNKFDTFAFDRCLKCVQSGWKSILWLRIAFNVTFLYDKRNFSDDNMKFFFFFLIGLFRFRSHTWSFTD